MSTEIPRDAWVPVALRWRHVIAGDVFVAPAGALWTVTRVSAKDAAWGVTAVQADKVHGAEVDPDDTVQVLVPVTEREAATVARELLGARLIERRSAA